MNGLGLLRQAIPRRERFGIVLAAGEGKRLRPLVRRWHDRDLPKQYVSFTGTRSMLEHTLHRARKLIPGDRLYTVVSQDHLPLAEARKQISGCPPDTVVLQPRDRGTGAGLLLPLLHLRRREPGAIVAVFPSDHFVLEEDLFMAYVKQAFGAVEEDPSRIVLLGVQPGEPEPEMGYILPNRERMGASAPSGLRRVREFVEKPSREVARELLRQGGLWNTLVMVFSTSTLLDLARRIAPVVLDAFERIDAAIGTPTERDVLQEAYRELKPLDLSRDVLQVLPIRNPSSLVVLPVRGVYWSDWGSEERVLRTLQSIRFRHRGGGVMSAAKKRNPGPVPLSRSVVLPGAEALRRRVAERAYELFMRRGRTHGRDVEDWLEAERVVYEEIAAPPQRRPTRAATGRRGSPGH